MTKDRRLGRGLAALLGTPIDDELASGSNGVNATAVGTSSTAMPTGTAGSKEEPPREASNFQSPQEAASVAPTALLIPVDQIDNNPFQPRREFNNEEIDSLAESIKEHQQLQPILVRKAGERYQIISGERRLRATIRAGLKSIRAEVREADDRLVAELAIIENLQRKDLNPIEKALSFRRYIHEHRCTQEDLAKRLKIDRSTVANFMRLLELPERILTAIQKDTISAGHARALLPLGDESSQLEFADRIQADGWSVRETERRVAERIAEEEAVESGRTSGTGKSPFKRTKSEQVQSLERELKLSLGTSVEIRQSSTGKGKIIIAFTNPEEFERIRGQLTSNKESRFRLAS